jgi:hypothetical protein
MIGLDLFSSAGGYLDTGGRHRAPGPLLLRAVEIVLAHRQSLIPLAGLDGDSQ